MFRFVDGYLRQKYEPMLEIIIGDLLESPTGVMFEVRQTSKAGKEILASRTGEDRKTQYSFANPWTKEMPSKQARLKCDLWQWFIHRKRTEKWCSISDEKSLEYGRAKDNGVYRVLCCECCEEGPSNKDPASCREEAEVESWLLREAYFIGKEKNIIEKWLCPECKEEIRFEHLSF